MTQATNPGSTSAVERARPPRGETRWLLLASLVGLALFLTILRYVPYGPVMRVLSTPSGSMAPNLNAGGYIFMDRLAYGLSPVTYDLFPLPLSGRWPEIAPSRGDVVVFRAPRDRKTLFVKRLVGLPGERVRMRAGRLVINGDTVAREEAPKVRLPGPDGRKVDVATFREMLPGAAPYLVIELQGDHGQFDDTPELVVPLGHYFVLGDNRDNSVDSRLAVDKGGIGFVPSELLIGQVVGAFGGE